MTLHAPMAQPMTGDDEATAVGAKPLRRFWRSALGFWVGAGSWMPWTLIGLLVVCVVSQLVVQYRLNLWNRDFFNALEQRDGAGIRQQTYLLPALAAASIALAATAVWGRMTFQRRWRDWLTSHLLGLWLDNDNYRRIEARAREPQLAEYRIAEDARVATDAPIDLLVGLLASVLTAATFVAVLWTVGGSLGLAGGFELPGYLVFASIVYAMITTAAMIARRPQHGPRHREKEPGRVGTQVRRGPAAGNRDRNRRGVAHPADRARGLRARRGHPPMAAPVRAACPHDPGVARQHAAGPVDRPDPVRAASTSTGPCRLAR